jgi:hypothetical protein
MKDKKWSKNKIKKFNLRKNKVDNEVEKNDKSKIKDK